MVQELALLLQLADVGLHLADLLLLLEHDQFDLLVVLGQLLEVPLCLGLLVLRKLVHLLPQRLYLILPFLQGCTHFLSLPFHEDILVGQ